MKKRLGSMVLALVMVLSMVPFRAMAADTDLQQPQLEAAVPSDGSSVQAEEGTGSVPSPELPSTVLTRGQWEKATVLEFGKTVQFTLNSNDTTATADQYWVAVNVPAGGKAVEFCFTNLANVRVESRLYQKAELEQKGIDQASCLRIYRMPQFSRVLPEGAYYLMFTGGTTQEVSSLTVQLLDGDTNEGETGNDTWQTATALTVHVPTKFHLHGHNDEDWFKVTTEKPDEALKLHLTDFDYTLPYISLELYRLVNEKTELISQVQSERLRADTIWNYKLSEPGEYYVRAFIDDSYDNVKGFTKPLKLWYELVPGDLHEPNDSEKTATELPDNQEVPFNLNGGNDADWFRFETTLVNQKAELYFSGFETDYSNKIRFAIYQQTPDGNAGIGEYDDRIDKTYHRSMIIREPGVYCIKVYADTRDGWLSVENMLKLRLQLLGTADTSEEPNDTWQTAKPLRLGIQQAFTMPTEGDMDWFKFTTDKPNQTVETTFTGSPKEIRYALYFGEDLKRDGPGADALNGGYDGYQLVDPGTYRWTLKEPGEYYIRLSHRSTFHYEAFLQVNLIDPDPQETQTQNDTWKTASPLRELVDTKLTLPGQNDVDWFKITVEDPDQTVKLTFSNVENKDYSWAVYSEADFKQHGDNADSLRYGESGFGTTTEYCMLDAPGNYYVCLCNKYQSQVLKEMTVRYELLAPDAYERNQTRETAAEVLVGADMRFTLPAANDRDWFKLNITEPNQTLELVLAEVPAEGAVQWELYYENGTDPIYHGEQKSGGSTNYWMLHETGTYYLQLIPRYKEGQHFYDRPFREAAILHCNLIQPDANEGNDTWKTATALQEGVDTVLTVPAANDRDWFKISVTEPNQTARMMISNIPKDCGTEFAVYREEDFIRDGDRANEFVWQETDDGTVTAYFMLEKPGNYYVKLFGDTWQDGWRVLPTFREELTIRYDLIQPDANEGNNSLETATLLKPGVHSTFTLPAVNDHDFFQLDCTVQKGDTIRFRTMKPITQEKWNSAQLYVQEPYQQIRRVGELYFGEMKDHPLDYISTVTASVNGTYYISLDWDYTRYHTWLDSLQDSMPFWYTVSRADVPAERIQIMDHKSILPVTETLTLNTAITPYYATNQAVTWTSDHPEVATVDAKTGMVTAVSVGDATITVTTEDGGLMDSCVMNIVAPIAASGVTVTPAYPEEAPKALTQDSYLDLRATLQPETTTNTAVTWSTSDPKVLTVTDYGRVYAVGSGKAKITVTTADGGFTADTWFSVPDESYPVTSIRLDQSNLTLYLEEEGQRLLATVVPDYATNPQLVWSCSDEKVATVDQTGLVTAVAPGYATVTVVAEENPGIKAECRISVQPKRIRVSGISFEKETMELGVYTQYQLTPTITPADATVQDVVWTTDNKTVATVSRGGKVTTVGLGYVNITATTKDGGYQATIRIHVGPTAAMGDLNNDGDIDVGDAIFILRYTVDLMALTQEQQLLADVSGDRMVDVADAVLILRYSTGLIDTFPGSKK